MFALTSFRGFYNIISQYLCWPAKGSSQRQFKASDEVGWVYWVGLSFHLQLYYVNTTDQLRQAEIFWIVSIQLGRLRSLVLEILYHSTYPENLTDGPTYVWALTTEYIIVVGINIIVIIITIIYNSLIGPWL